MASNNIILNEMQTRLKHLAENVVLEDKIVRQNSIIEMNSLVRNLSVDELITVINSIAMFPALKFLIPAGVYGDARIVLFARIAALQPRKV